MSNSGDKTIENINHLLEAENLKALEELIGYQGRRVFLCAKGKRGKTPFRIVVIKDGKIVSCVPDKKSAKLKVLNKDWLFRGSEVLFMNENAWNPEISSINLESLEFQKHLRELELMPESWPIGFDKDPKTNEILFAFKYDDFPCIFIYDDAKGEFLRLNCDLLIDCPLENIRFTAKPNELVADDIYDGSLKWLLTIKGDGVSVESTDKPIKEIRREQIKYPDGYHTHTVALDDHGNAYLAMEDFVYRANFPFRDLKKKAITAKFIVRTYEPVVSLFLSTDKSKLISFTSGGHLDCHNAKSLEQIWARYAPKVEVGYFATWEDSDNLICAHVLGEKGVGKKDLAISAEDGEELARPEVCDSSRVNECEAGTAVYMSDGVRVKKFVGDIMSFVYEHTGVIRTMDFSEMDGYLASGCSSGLLHVYDVNEDSLIFEHEISEPISCVRWMENGDEVLLVKLDEKVQFYDMKEKIKIAEYELNRKNGLFHLV